MVVLFRRNLLQHLAQDVAGLDQHVGALRSNFWAFPHLLQHGLSHVRQARNVILLQVAGRSFHAVERTEDGIYGRLNLARIFEVVEVNQDGLSRV